MAQYSFLLIIVLLYAQITLASPSKQLESSFAAASVLTDGDSLTLGYGSFDPKAFISPHHNDEAELNNVDIRQQLTLYSIPYDWQLKQTLFGFKTSLLSQVSYLKQSQTLNLFEQEIADDNDETMHSARLGISFEKPISSKWFYQGEFNTHLMHYKNEYTYASDKSRQAIKPLANGLYTNIQSNVLMFNPSASLIYRLPRHWGYYEYRLKASYYYGWALSQPDQIAPINPESLQVNNGIKAKFNMFTFNNFQQAFYVKAQRVDLNGDSQAPLGADHFYEYGLGIIWDVTKWTDWFDNFGIGVNINNGSSLDGGTIVLYFNEI